MTATKPEKYLGEDNAVWSNYDGIMEVDVVLLLAEGDCYASHFAWDYAGCVWYDPESNLWYEEVWRYGMLVEVISGDSATNVIAKTLAEYGVN